MIASLVNGVPGDQVSILDRGLQFGDGLFETLAVKDGIPCLWKRHMARLAAGCARLGIAAPEPGLLQEESHKLIGDERQAALKITLTRGRSERGYGPADAVPTRILSLFPWDGPGHSGLTVAIASRRLGVNPDLAGLKHLNRLEQVLARREQPPGVRESIMFDINGHLVEGIAANIFLQQGERLLTPRLDENGVTGVVRELVMDLARDMGQPVEEGRLGHQDLLRAQAIYFSSSLLGIRPVASIPGQDWQPVTNMHPVLEAAGRQVFTP
ncbi:aminodeoxychorismate lyase [Thiolapillus sp.]